MGLLQYVTGGSDTGGDSREKKKKFGEEVGAHLT